jgi:DNA-directed RNA polymerase subunit N (RpoN/RPB10)
MNSFLGLRYITHINIMILVASAVIPVLIAQLTTRGSKKITRQDILRNGVTVLILGLVGIMLYNYLGRFMSFRSYPEYFALTFLIILVIPGTIFLFVYKDAKTRKMPSLLWALIATFVPGFIGLIIYLVVRQAPSVKCLNCGKSIGKDYKVCPHCLASTSLRCPKCSNQVSDEWKVCPYCQEQLNQMF